MSNESDGSGRPDDIIIIKQLLQKLEEAAARDVESPGVDMLEPDEAADRVGVEEIIVKPVRDEPPLLELSSGRSGASANSQLSLSSDSEAMRPLAMPEFSRLPISIDLPPQDTALVTVPAEEPPARGRPGLAVAGLSFALGIVAAAALIMAFDPFGQRGGGAKVARAPSPIVQQPARSSANPADVVELPAASANATNGNAGEAQAGQIARPVSDGASPPAGAAIASVGSAAVPAAAVVQPLETKPVIEAKPADATPDRGATKAAPGSVAAPGQASAPPEKTGIRIPARIELKAGERRTIDLRVDAPSGDVSRLLVVFRQVPGWMSFSRGGAIGNDIWLLPAQQVRDLEVEVTDGASGGADVKVQLARVDGSILSETSVAFVAASPTSAPMSAGSAVVPSGGSEATILRLQARGELLLDTGEVEAARTLLRTAAEAGSVAAALRLAETYDPAEIQRLGMADRSADLGQAVRWYEHAQALGSPVAAARLIALGRR